ncbi:MAG: tRNA pseudouridine(55) synthase TruB [bacterium]|nr:tRNA pseudouridine(55) synthase TruB [bacterium]
MIEGFLLINKPSGKTSYDCVEHIKRLIGKKVKIGHAGTLDPFATGLLIIALERNATRILGQLLSLDKEYIAQGKLGIETDTLDVTGETIRYDARKSTEQEIRQAIERLGSSYLQTPPIYSALKFEGNRLYELARSGKKSMQELESMVHEKAKEVHLYALNLVDFDLPFFTIRAHVSHGTYIRSLVRDIAYEANNCATTYTLQRTKIGPYSIEQSVDLINLQTIDDIMQYVISIDQFLESIPTQKN